MNEAYIYKTDKQAEVDELIQIAKDAQHIARMAQLQRDQAIIKARIQVKRHTLRIMKINRRVRDIIDKRARRD